MSPRNSANSFSNGKIKDKVLSTLSDLDKRQQDVLIRRFGLQGKNPETLDAIGKRYGITRERVRQIVNSVLSKLRQRGAGDYIVEEIAKIEDLLATNGGLMTHNNIIKELLGDKAEDYKLAGISFVLYFGENFLEKKEDSYCHRAWYLSDQIEALDIAKRVIQDFSKILNKRKKALPGNELFSVYQKEGKFEIGEEILLNYLTLSKEILANSFNEWGFAVWGEIVPRGVRDKAYLVLKHSKKAMHFTEITNEINKMGLDSKKAFAPTVHNELIKDKRFVLVGRGLYALSDWGYIGGTVKDVMIDILSDNSKTMKIKELVRKVLHEREVKKSTIMLNIQNNDCFERVDKTTVKLTK